MEGVEFVSPGAALLGFFGLAGLLALLFWPGRGLVPRWLLSRWRTERVLLEDALKYLHNCEYGGRSCNIDGIAEGLGLSAERAEVLVGSLAGRGLCELSEGRLALTRAGRSYALRVLRRHRLWERYLADRTGLPAGEWHEEAERVEHTLTPAQVEVLAAQLGNPIYDPHGDPIPSVDGRVPPAEGVVLTKMGAGEVGVVVHLEDEPREVYERLVTGGLGPGMPVEVVGRDADAVQILAGGVEHELEPAAARSVTVRPGVAAGVGMRDLVPLTALGAGETGVVAGIVGSCQGPQRRRLLDLGVVPGTRVTAELFGVSGDPVAYRIRGALIALRREQADWIRVRSEAEEDS